MNELRSVMATVLTNVQLSVDTSLPEPLYVDTFVMRAKHGIHLLVKSLWRLLGDLLSAFVLYVALSAG